MATRTKKATSKGEALARAASKTYTEAEVAAMLAKAFADGKASGRSSLPRDAGFHEVELTPKDAGANVLARCVVNTGSEQFIGTAIMQKDRTIAVGIQCGRGWTPGIRVVGGKPGELAARAKRLAANAAECEAYLLATAAKAAKTHVYVERKKSDD